MSTQTSDTAVTGAPADHVPHVLPLRVYFGVFAMLILFTFLTVWVSYQDFGNFDLLVALLIAGAKAMMVMTIFMHLAFDKKFNAIIFSLSFLFLLVFIGITMRDTETRGRFGGPTFVSKERAVDPAMPFGPGATKSEQALIKEWGPPETVPPKTEQ